jgi:hypothetical protein
MEFNEPVTVYTVSNPYEAEIIKMALRSEGILCELDGERQAGLSDVLGIGILVRASDAQRALRLIKHNDVTEQNATLNRQRGDLDSQA